ncbi:hypothetical protein BN1708_016440, partial [Verticillium longisporum]
IRAGGRRGGQARPSGTSVAREPGRRLVDSSRVRRGLGRGAKRRIINVGRDKVGSRGNHDASLLQVPLDFVAVEKVAFKAGRRDAKSVVNTQVFRLLDGRAPRSGAEVGVPRDFAAIRFISSLVSHRWPRPCRARPAVLQILKKGARAAKMEKGVTPITERFASVHTEAVSKALNDAFPALEEQAEAEDAGDYLRRRFRHGKQAHRLLYRPALQPPAK